MREWEVWQSRACFISMQVQPIIMPAPRAPNLLVLFEDPKWYVVGSQTGTHGETGGAGADDCNLSIHSSASRYGEHVASFDTTARSLLDLRTTAFDPLQ